METIGERLKSAREKLNLDQGKFAKELGAGGRTTISQWERGISFPSANILKTIHEKFGIDINWLLTGEGDMEGDSPPAGTIDIDSLRQIISGVERGLAAKHRILDPEKKARLIALLYDHFVVKQSGIEEETVDKYLELVV